MDPVYHSTWLRAQDEATTAPIQDPIWSLGWLERVRTAANRIQTQDQQTKIPLAYFVNLLRETDCLMPKLYPFSICVLANLVDFVNASDDDLQTFKELVQKYRQNGESQISVENFSRPFGDYFEALQRKALAKALEETQADSKETQADSSDSRLFLMKGRPTVLETEFHKLEVYANSIRPRTGLIPFSQFREWYKTESKDICTLVVVVNLVDFHIVTKECIDSFFKKHIDNELETYVRKRFKKFAK